MFLQQIETALRGAKYHEDSFFFYAKPSQRSPANYEKIIYHLRAYFWELWSVWDYILQNANAQTLGLDPRKVRAGGFLIKLEREQPSYTFLAGLQDIADDERLQRTGKLRHYAHRWIFEPYQVEVRDDEVQVICLWFQEGTRRNQVNIDRNDLAFMSRIVEELKSTGFFN